MWIWDFGLRLRFRLSWIGWVVFGFVGSDRWMDGCGGTEWLEPEAPIVEKHLPSLFAIGGRGGT
jgi:hypothetical protein